MSDNQRSIFYEADELSVLALLRSVAVTQLSRAGGRHCETGDIVARDDYLLADLAPRSFLAVLGTGA